MTPLIVICGPTAVGKTAVAVEVAGQLGTEVISADSMQVYRHLSVGTAKPTSEELRGVPCKMVDIVDPDYQFNLGDFVEAATGHVERLLTEGRVPVVCGGTGLYIRGLLHGVFDGPTRDMETRRTLAERAERDGLPALHEELARVDPAAAARIPKADRQRILRALEVWHVTGRRISDLQTQGTDAQRWPARTFVLALPRELLYQRINDRVALMVERGLLDEVRRYLDAGFQRTNPAVRALGYAELIEHLEGSRTLESALEAMAHKSRNYAKRQLTWFRGVREAEWVDVSGKTAAEIARHIIGVALSRETRGG